MKTNEQKQAFMNENEHIFNFLLNIRYTIRGRFIGEHLKIGEQRGTGSNELRLDSFQRRWNRLVEP
ncbi:hypothetical protein Hanom_Chr13g01213181 [Helianthus anomalus]